MYTGVRSIGQFSRPTSAKVKEGIYWFIRRHLRAIKRVQYSVVFLIAFAVLIFQIYECVEKYLERNTGTGDKYEHTSKVPFPEMTICPTYPYRLNVLNKNGISGKNNIQLGAQWISNDTSVTPIQLYDEAVIPIQNVVHSIRLYFEKLIDGKNIIDLKPNDNVCGNEKLFETKPYYWNGDCFGLVIPGCLAEAGILEIVMEFYDKTDIFIHHTGQFLSPNSRSRVDVDKGKFVKIAISHEVVQLLSGEEFSNCEPDLNYDDCMYTNLYDLMTEKVGCTVPWLPRKDNICNDPIKSKETFEVYQQNRRNQEYICPKSCLFTNMYFGPPVTGTNDPVRQQYAWGVFYFRRDIKMTTEYEVYAFLSMAAEIGAFVGLLLGASLLHLGGITNSLLEHCFNKNESQHDQKDLNTSAAGKTKINKISIQPALEEIEDVEGRF